MQNMENTTRRPTVPTSNEAETIVLGCAMAYPETAFDLFEGVKPEFFLSDLNRRLCGKMLALIRDGLMPDPTTVFAAFATDKGLADMGGEGYLLGLVATAPNLETSKQSAATLSRLYGLRRLQEYGKLIEGACNDWSDSDPDSLLNEGRAVFEEISFDLEGRREVGLFDSVSQQIAHLKEDKPPRSFGTGFEFLDAKLPAGIRPSNMVVVAARPSMGKSTVGHNLGLGIARQRCTFEGQQMRRGVLLLSPEMNREENTIRLISTLARTNGTKIPYFALAGERYDARSLDMAQPMIEMFADIPLVIDDTGRRTVSSITQQIKRLRHDWLHQGILLSAVIIDQLSQLQPRGKVSGVYERFTQISNDIKGAAKETDTAIIVLHQIGRGVEDSGRKDKRPNLADLKQTGAIEEDADIVLFPHRQAHYAKQEMDRKPADAELRAEYEDTKREIEFIIAKNKMGPTGLAKLYCEIEHNFISDRRPDDPTIEELPI